MKTYFIRNSKDISRDFRNGYSEFVAVGDDDMLISDSYHTMDELYEHRIVLFIALCKALNKKYPVWKSTAHSDGSLFEGWFIMGINAEPGKQITYHLPMSKWEETNFVEEVTFAPVWDNHSPSDVLERLKKL